VIAALPQVSPTAVQCLWRIRRMDRCTDRQTDRRAVGVQCILALLEGSFVTNLKNFAIK